jgi:NhaP-type Na+/H+ or K+/H+ antiporter
MDDIASVCRVFGSALPATDPASVQLIAARHNVLQQIYALLTRVPL